MRRAGLILLLGALALAPGCATLSPPAPETAETAGKTTVATAQTLRANAVVEIQRVFSVKGRALIAAQSPDKFRIEVLGPLNATVALFVSDGTELYIFSEGKSARYDWADPRVPFPFRPAEVVSALLGERPAGDYGVFTDNDGRVVRVVRKEGGRDILDARMEDYRTVDGAQVPFSITIRDRKKGLGIRYSSVSVNPKLPAGFFDASRLP